MSMFVFIKREKIRGSQRPGVSNPKLTERSITFVASQPNLPPYKVKRCAMFPSQVGSLRCAHLPFLMSLIIVRALRLKKPPHDIIIFNGMRLTVVVLRPVPTLDSILAITGRRPLPTGLFKSRRVSMDIRLVLSDLYVKVDSWLSRAFFSAPLAHFHSYGLRPLAPLQEIANRCLQSFQRAIISM